MGAKARRDPGTLEAYSKTDLVRQTSAERGSARASGTDTESLMENGAPWQKQCAICLVQGSLEISEGQREVMLQGTLRTPGNTPTATSERQGGFAQSPQELVLTAPRGAASSGQRASEGRDTRCPSKRA